MGLSVALVCAVLASLALGVLVAYALCVSMFHLFRIHARQVAVRKAATWIPVASARPLSE